MNYNDQDIYEDELTRMRDRHAHKTRKMPAESAIGQNAGEAAQERSRTVRSRRRRRGGFVSRGDEIPPGVRLSPTTPTASE